MIPLRMNADVVVIQLLRSGGSTLDQIRDRLSESPAFDMSRSTVHVSLLRLHRERLVEVAPPTGTPGVNGKIAMVYRLTSAGWSMADQHRAHAAELFGLFRIDT